MLLKLSLRFGDIVIGNAESPKLSLPVLLLLRSKSFSRLDQRFDAEAGLGQDGQGDRLWMLSMWPRPQWGIHPRIDAEESGGSH